MTLSDDYLRGKDVGELIDRQEVVDWINLEIFENSSGYIFGDEEVFSTSTFHRAWQAQKKTWGLK